MRSTSATIAINMRRGWPYCMLYPGKLRACGPTPPTRGGFPIWQRIASALLTQRTTPIWQFISCEQFQITLPGEQITIILLADGIGPVGAIQY